MLLPPAEMTRPKKEKKLANLIIAGVNKAGSTSLFHYLSAHPDITGSKDKETCYFLPVLYDQPVASISDYEAQFDQTAQVRYRLEATPGYMTGGAKMAAVISDTLRDVKIIIILKEPSERLVSFYKRKKATLQLPRDLSFRDFVKKCRKMKPADLKKQENHLYSALATGIYAETLEPWLQKFDGNIKVVFFDQLQNDSQQFMMEIAQWLKIDESFYLDFDFEIKNRSMNYKNQLLQQLAVKANKAGQRFWRNNPGIKKNLLALYYKVNGTDFSKDEIDLETLNFLQNFYLPHNQRLHNLLLKYGMENKIPGWLEPEKELA